MCFSAEALPKVALRGTQGPGAQEAEPDALQCGGQGRVAVCPPGTLRLRPTGTRQASACVHGHALGVRTQGCRQTPRGLCGSCSTFTAALAVHTMHPGAQDGASLKRIANGPGARRPATGAAQEKLACFLKHLPYRFPWS